MTNILIIVRGGLIQEISTDQPITVILIDHDNMSQGGDVEYDYPKSNITLKEMEGIAKEAEEEHQVA